MDFKKDKWTKKDFNQYYDYQKSLIGSDLNCSWEQRIVNTKLKCYARTSSKAREIVKSIAKGNYLSFLDNVIIKTHFDSLVCAFLICKIKDFDIFTKHLMKYVPTIDNWASCDTLKFKRYDSDKLFKLSTKLLKSKKEFIRRVGINIYFNIYKDQKYIYEAFKIFDNMKDCKQYYVNMVCAWLLSFLYVKYPKQTLQYFKHNDTNDFIINKAISKCHDSYRISQSDKQMLKRYKKQKYY